MNANLEFLKQSETFPAKVASSFNWIYILSFTRTNTAAFTFSLLDSSCRSRSTLLDKEDQQPSVSTSQQQQQPITLASHWFLSFKFFISNCSQIHSRFKLMCIHCRHKPLPNLQYHFIQKVPVHSLTQDQLQNHSSHSANNPGEKGRSRRDYEETESLLSAHPGSGRFSDQQLLWRCCRPHRLYQSQLPAKQRAKSQ